MLIPTMRRLIMHKSDKEPDIEELKKQKFELQDISASVIKKVALGFSAFILGCTGLAWLIYYYTVPNVLHPRVTYKVHEPPTPHLQTNTTAKTDMKDLLKKEHEQLSSYKWINPQKGIVRIPIEKAIELTLKNGLSTGVSEKTESETKQKMKEEATIAKGANKQ